MTGDVTGLLVRIRMAELRAEADAERLCPRRRRPTRVRPALRRWYVRVWWAARPRAAAWTPDPLGN